MAENFANNARAVLSGNIGTVDTTLVVDSAASFPAPNFRIVIDNEYMHVTGVSGNVLTVTRALEGSSAAQHASGADVVHVITAGGLDAYFNPDAALDMVVVNTIALLRAVSSVSNSRVIALGYYAARDGGGGLYALDSADTTTADDGGAVIVGNDGARWKLIHDTQIDARQYGAKFDGATNDSTAINAGLTYVKTNGLTLKLPAGTTKVKNLSVAGGVKPWAMVGSGKTATILEHNDGDSTLITNGASGSAVAFTLSDFTVDCRFSQLAHASANHGISITDVSNLRVERLIVKNYKNTAILVYDQGNTGAFSNNWIIDCTATGNGATTNNGMLIADMKFSGFIRSNSTDCDGSPGYGVQLKNNCVDSAIIDCWGKNCKSAIAFGNDASPTAGVQRSYVTNGKSYGCDAAFVGGEIFNSTVHMAFVDMENFAGYPIGISGASSGNKITVDTVINLASNRSVFNFEDTSNGNSAHVGIAKDRNTTGTVVTFGSSTTNNHVTFGALVNPTDHTSGFRSLGTFNSSTGNSLDTTAMPNYYRVTIASDAIHVRNLRAEVVELNTEASAASDDLATISMGTTAPYIGQKITLRLVSNSQLVNVKHGTGNIRLHNAADFLLYDNIRTLTLQYNNNSQWCQVPGIEIGPQITNSTSTAYTVLPADINTYLRFTNASAKAVTFNSTLTLGEYHIRNVGAADLTLTAGGGVTLNAPSGGTLVMATGMTATVKKVGAAEFDVFGQTKP